MTISLSICKSFKSFTRNGINIHITGYEICERITEINFERS